ncbi:hypothetical protein AB3X52_15820 [Nocardioides sp. DS6]|uniref:Uncharacterized protein n=1 Tax=Nocardioides eburneus TaxID=3231482 RepID=A0ABV3T341_9ACTN
MTEKQRPEDDQSDDQSEGQVSEVQRLGDDTTGTPQAPEDSTAGYPDSESGGADEGAAGPESSPPENRRDNENSRSGHRRPGQSIEDEKLP